MLSPTRVKFSDVENVLYGLASHYFFSFQFLVTYKIFYHWGILQYQRHFLSKIHASHFKPVYA